MPKKTIILFGILLLVVLSFGENDFRWGSYDNYILYAEDTSNKDTYYIVIASSGMKEGPDDYDGVYVLDEKTYSIIGFYHTLDDAHLVRMDTWWYWYIFYVYYDNVLIKFHVDNGNLVKDVLKKCYSKDLAINYRFNGKNLIVTKDYSGPKNGDYIVKINGEYVDKTSDITKILKDYYNDNIEISVARSYGLNKVDFTCQVVKNKDYIIKASYNLQDDRIVVVSEHFIKTYSYDLVNIDNIPIDYPYYFSLPEYCDMNQNGTKEEIFIYKNNILINENGKITRLKDTNISTLNSKNQDFLLDPYFADVNNDGYPEAIIASREGNIDMLIYDSDKKIYKIQNIYNLNSIVYFHPIVKTILNNNLNIIVGASNGLYIISPNGYYLSKLETDPVISEPFMYTKNGYYYIAFLTYNKNRKEEYLYTTKIEGSSISVITKNIINDNCFHLLSGIDSTKDGMYATLSGDKLSITRIDDSGYYKYSTDFYANNSFMDYTQYQISNITSYIKIGKENENFSSEEISERMKSVVEIINTYSENGGDYVSTGSGFIIAKYDNRYYIATNSHVVGAIGAIEKDSVVSNYNLKVIFENGDKAYPSKVYVAKDMKDIAIVVVNARDINNKNLEPLPLEIKNYKIGREVYALGNPENLSFSFTRGVVSAVRYEKISSSYNINSDKFFESIQTDAAINHGNSGGPLIDSNGNVIGINSLGYEKNVTEGLNFAISASDLYEEIQNNNFYKIEYLPYENNNWLIKSIRMRFREFIK